MSELKPTTEESIRHFETQQKRYVREHNGKLCPHYANAIEALRRAQPANEPLTLEQLRKMDGEPVYLVIENVNGFNPITMWALVEIEEDGIWLTSNLGGRNFYEDAIDDGINVYARKTEMKGSENECIN